MNVDVIAGVSVGVIIGLVLGIIIFFGSTSYKDGAIAATKGEYVCKQVPQFVGEPQWQCRSVYGE